MGLETGRNGNGLERESEVSINTLPILDSPLLSLNLLSSIIDSQPPEVRELLQFSLVQLLSENGRAAIIERRTTDAREQLFIRT